MKKLSLKKSLIIAAAAMLVIGTAAVASNGTVRFIRGSSSAIPDYTTVPDSKVLSDRIGFAPKIFDEFSNGYTFESGSERREEVIESENAKISSEGSIAKYNAISCKYVKGGDKLIYSADAEGEAHKGGEIKPVSETYKGVDIKYNSYTGKFVPADYKLTEQDKIDEVNGDVIFSYGTDEVEIYEIQGVSWEQDGIYYNITGMNSPLDEEELIAMAKEAIDR